MATDERASFCRVALRLRAAASTRCTRAAHCTKAAQSPALFGAEPRTGLRQRPSVCSLRALAQSALYIVDGSNFIFRAFHALPQLMTRAGVPTGAVYGFVQMLLRLELDEEPSHLLVVFDKGKRSFRNALYADYKANRSETPSELVPQFDLVRKVVAALSLPTIELEGYEADDTIASLVRIAKEAGLPVVMVTSDKDLMQLIDDRCSLLDTMRKSGERVGHAEVEEKFGVGPALVGDVLALMGDSIDNVPGVPGVGPKTAAQLVKHFGSIEAMLARVDEIETIPGLRGAKGVAEKIRAHADAVRLSRRLVSLDDHAPVPTDLEAFRRLPPDLTKLEPLAKELEFERLLTRLRGQGAGTEAPPPLSTGTAQALPPVAIATDTASLAAWLDALPAGEPVAVAFAAPHGSSLSAPLVGLALAAAGRDGIYLPLGHRYIGAPQLAERDQSLALVGKVLADPARGKIVFDAKRAWQSADRLGLVLDGVRGDVQLSSYLLDAGADHSLTAQAKTRLAIDVIDPAGLGGTGKRATALEMLDAPAVATATGHAAAAMLSLWPLLHGDLIARKELRLLEDIELPLGHLLAKLEATGILIDVPVLHRLAAEAEKEMTRLEGEVAQLTGVSINLGSPKQLAELLFEKLGLPPSKKTKTGYSTDAEVLEELSPLHPAIDKILDHRAIGKLKGTYLDALPQLVDTRTGRLHTSYEQTVAATGRLSSTEPNLQNVPVRTGLGMQIRAAFIAGRGKRLIVADYSQIELRVLAHLSGDPVLTDSFTRGEDVHERTVAEMFGEAKRHDKEMRRVAKMINYGIVYGLSDFGLAQRLGIPRGDAKQYIQHWGRTYSTVQSYMAGLVEQARREGGARTILGRFRPLPELAQKNYAVRQYGERMAKNTPIQGTAADLLKLAMIEVDRRLAAEFPTAQMLLTVHDELVFEADEADAPAVAARAASIMETVMPLSVPLVVEHGIGVSWADCKSAKVVQSSAG